MIGSLPNITCVTVTKNRPERLLKAIHCYIQQSYINKNMVIVSQSCSKDNDIIRRCLQELNRNDIQFFVAAEDLSLGAMRNVAVELATGEIICQWDDDDLYHPDRMMLQYNVLRSDSRNVGSAYCDFLKYFEPVGEVYWCDWSGEPLISHRYLCGSIMFRKWTFGQFPCFYPQTGPQSAIEEDLNVIGKLLLKGSIGSVWSAWHYVYVYHGNNIYDLEHHKLTLNTTWGKKILTKQQLLERRDLIEQALSSLDRPVKVCSKEGEAFLIDRNRRNC